MQAAYGIPDFEIDDELEQADTAFGVSVPPIVAYVEAEIDKNFWRQRFSKLKFPTIEFREISQHEPANGKDAIVSAISRGHIKLTKHTIVCLDSDYDYLLKKNSSLYQSDFTFQTYAYSIENFFYHPNGLSDFIQDKIDIRDSSTLNLLEDKICEWSNVYYNRFCHFLIQGGSTQKADIARISEKLSLTDIEPCCGQYQPCQIKLNEFNQLGLQPNRLHVFFRGHNLEAKVYSNIVKEYVKRLRDIRKDLIQNSEELSQDEKNSLISNLYTNDTNLKDSFPNRDFDSIPEIVKIDSKILAFQTKYWP